MESSRFRLNLSVRTKLLLILVFLLSSVIIVLNLSAITVLSRDKRMSVYQQQATEISNIGREIVDLVQRNSDLLKLVGSNLDPKNPMRWSSKRSALQNIIENQNDLFLIRVFKFDPKNKTLNKSFGVYRKDLAKNLKLDVDTITLMPEMMTELAPTLTNKGIALYNSTGAGQPPLLSILIADINNPLPDGSLLVIAGFTHLKEFVRLDQNELTIANQEGWVIFNSEPSVEYLKLNIKNEQQFNLAKESTLSSGTTEFKIASGRFLGSFYKPGFDLLIQLKTPWDLAMMPVFSLIEHFVLIGLMAISLAVLCAILFSRSMVAPLQKLSLATRQIALGDFNLDLKPTSNDELGDLTTSFNLMSKEISKLIEDKLKKVKLENEIAIASTVQQNLIPPSSIDTPYFSIHSRYIPAEVCGGDWWGYFKVDRYACFAVADATGHGLSSALITAAMRSCYSVIETLYQENHKAVYSPSEILSFANRAIFDSANGQIMMTLFLGVLDLETGELTFSNAGHNPQWVFRKSSEQKTEFQSLVLQGYRLGEKLEVPKFEEKKVKLEAGDILFLYTDGLIEGTSLEGQQFSKRAALKITEQQAAFGPAKMIDQLDLAVQQHNLGKTLDDDVTLVAIQIKKIGRSNDL